ncbi:hypothetical protein C8J57DRAFT_1332479 [Mycena rebaudengoi]|nr:hypothetical protein C8J57DRAFT_1332479 [Mycena rebaudengoi]
MFDRLSRETHLKTMIVAQLSGSIRHTTGIMYTIVPHLYWNEGTRAAATFIAAAAATTLVSAEEIALTPEAYAATLSVDSILGHLREFQKFANASANTRMHGSSGYTDSADYVYGVAQEAGLDVQRQGVSLAVGVVTTSTLTVDGVIYPAPNVTVDFFTTTTDTGGFTSVLTSLAGDGCLQQEWSDFKGMVVMVKAGGQCDKTEKTFNALVSHIGMVIIIYDETPKPPVPGAGIFAYAPGSETETSISVPVVFNMDYYTAQALLQKMGAGPITSTATVIIDARDVKSDNIIAQTKWGDQSKIIMIGSHLDSVNAGPGINDNGSGSATLLELVKQLSKFSAGKYSLRFGWWMAEERGVIGSTYYVKQLSQQERDKIVAYINLDMTASPNYILGVQDNDNSGGGRPQWIPRILQDAFKSMALNCTGFAVESNSDHAPFIDAGIVVGGLATGASGRKTELEAQIFGGVVGQRYDDCYHAACDTIDNLSHEALILNGRAIARALANLANDISAIEEEKTHHASSAKFRAKPDVLSDLGKHSH